MASRQIVTIFSASGEQSAETTHLPAVFSAPIRPDVVLLVHTNMNKNRRQAYAVKENAGHQHSAESWGTGRAVARIPRISGSGTSRAGQGAFGNMCRGGRMFNPTKIWRRWHRHSNQNEKRFATVSALAASAYPALVLARGHNIQAVNEIPLVIDDSVQEVKKTRAAVELLKKINAYGDVERVANSRKIRAGRGKARNRRHTQRKGPLVIYNEDSGIVKAFRNIPGIDLCNVDRLNLLQLAPGGHLGRFIIWTKGAFNKLDAIYGNGKEKSELKKDYFLPTSMVSNPDITRIINSDEVQSVLRPAKAKTQPRAPLKHNPLRNMQAMAKLNPFAVVVRRAELLKQEKNKRGEKVKAARTRKTLKVEKTNRAAVKALLA